MCVELLVYDLSTTISAQFPMSSSTTPMATPSEIWNDILEGDVQKDDSLWEDYLVSAAEFDKRMVDDLNKIVDVLLVFVGYFMLHSLWIYFLSSNPT